MSIIGAAFVPHTPLLLPTVDPKHATLLRPLHNAYAVFTQWVHALQPDVIICCNPHALSVGNAFTFNLTKHFTATFETLGDLTTTVQFSGTPKFTYQLKEHHETHLPIALSHETHVNYGIGIPALLLHGLPRQPSWVELSSRHSTPADHVQFGMHLQEQLVNARERILLLASGEITTRVGETTSEKSESAGTFLAQWLASARHGTLETFLMQTRATLADDVQSCGTWSLAQLVGMLHSIRVVPNELYTGTPFGVAYQLLTWQPK